MSLRALTASFHQTKVAVEIRIAEIKDFDSLQQSPSKEPKVV